MKRAGLAVLVANAVAAVTLSACSAGNQVGALQVPTVVTGTVHVGTTAAPAPGALVRAAGTSGTVQTRADGAGRYQLSVVTGVWVLEARAADGSRPGPPVTIDVGAAQRVTRPLRTG